MDAIFLTLLIIVLLGKYASGSHSGRSRDMVTLGLLLGVEIIPCIVDPSISVHDNTMSKLLFLAVFIHTASALRLLTRTWCSSAKRENLHDHTFLCFHENDNCIVHMICITHLCRKNITRTATLKRALTYYEYYTGTERFYNLERLVSKALPTILLIVLHTFVWMVVFAIIGMKLFGGKVWNQVALNSFQIDNDWCTTNNTKVCAGYDDQYNFNTMTSSLISLYVASQKPFIFSNIFYELCGSDSYVYFVLYWLFVPIANLLVLKAVLFQRYWTEMKLLEDLTLWYKEKERIYLKNQKRKKKHHHHHHHHTDVKEGSSHVAQFVDRVKSFGSVIHNEFLSER